MKLLLKIHSDKPTTTFQPTNRYQHKSPTHGQSLQQQNQNNDAKNLMKNNFYLIICIIVIAISIIIYVIANSNVTFLSSDNLISNDKNENDNNININDDGILSDKYKS